MFDPIIFTINLGFIQLPIRWYGVLIVLGALAGAWYASWYFKRNNEDPEIVWDVMIWLLISGILGARVWYVINDIIGGNTRYLDNPIQIIRIDQGGLNILGGVVVATLVGLYYCRKYQVDFWLLADACLPGLLIGQAIGRWGNFINQELYGPPTNLPWGISIAADHRLPQWSDLSQFPVESTFFHPTFAYEMLWNLLWAAVIFAIITKREEIIKTGMISGFALMIAGIGRTWIELFRPDQPSFFGASFSTSTVISIIFALIGLFILLARMGKISIGFLAEGEREYKLKPKPTRRPARQR